MAAERLFTPGPTPIPDRIRRAMAAPIIHHRTPEFSALFRESSLELRQVFGTGEDVLILAASGTGGLEAAFVNLCRKDGRVVTVNAGKFGERWTDLARAYAVPVDELEIPYGEACDPDRLAAFLDRDPRPAQAVCLTHSETSTGALHDVEALARVAKERGALVLVDAITSLAVHELKPDTWGLDAVVSGSQKGLMLPPGLAFVSLSARARQAMKQSDLPRFYFDLAAAYKGVDKGSTPFTPAVTLVIGLKESLAILLQEGIPNVVARHARLARACRAAIVALGLPLFARAPSNGVTAVGPLSGVSADGVVRHLREAHGIRIAGGQGSMKGQIFRVGHMGDYRDSDILDFTAALEATLTSLGHRFTPGSGVEAARGALGARAGTAGR